MTKIEHHLLALIDRKEGGREHYTRLDHIPLYHAKSIQHFEKDTRMTCLQLLIWRNNIYGYRAGPFRKNLWKDRHRRSHDVLPLSGRRQRTAVWTDVR